MEILTVACHFKRDCLEISVLYNQTKNIENFLLTSNMILL